MADAAVHLPNRQRKEDERQPPAPSEEGKAAEDVIHPFEWRTGPHSGCVQRYTDEVYALKMAQRALLYVHRGPTGQGES